MVVNIDELENNLDRFLTDLKDDELADGSVGVYNTNVRQFVNY